MKTFVVEGFGGFPLDMLRYDRCWPLAEADSRAIAASIDYGFGQRRITLATASDSAPTVDRWKSFGWRVVRVGEVV